MFFCIFELLIRGSKCWCSAKKMGFFSNMEVIPAFLWTTESHFIQCFAKPEPKLCKKILFTYIFFSLQEQSLKRKFEIKYFFNVEHCFFHLVKREKIFCPSSFLVFKIDHIRITGKIFRFSGNSQHFWGLSKVKFWNWGPITIWHNLRSALFEKILYIFNFSYNIFAVDRWDRKL